MNGGFFFKALFKAIPRFIGNSKRCKYGNRKKKDIEKILIVTYCSETGLQLFHGYFYISLQSVIIRKD